MCLSVRQYFEKFIGPGLFGFLLALLLSPSWVQAQTLSGFEDNFEDQSVDTTIDGSTYTLWQSSDQQYYTIDERDGVLNITYSRNGREGGDEFVIFKPPEEIDVTATPYIAIDIKSDESTTLTLRIVYTGPPTFIQSTIQQELAGDNSWHRYYFKLNPENYSVDPINSVSFYFDQDKWVSAQKHITFDNLKIAGFSVQVMDVEASVSAAGQVELNWSADKPEAVDHYRIYRSSSSGFQAGENTLAGESASTSFADTGLQTYATYYYKVAAVDTSGEEHLPSDEISVETYDPTVSPAIEVTSTNADQVPKYEKFELKLALDNVHYSNPYDPDDIDVYAWFKSPAGDTTWVNGFFDNYQNRDQWKLRFSPNKTGEWQYQVFVKDAAGTGNGVVQSFTAVDSEHHGWIKPSTRNPHYFVHDDGTSYYGIGVYSPWGNNQSRFDTFSENKANLFALWNINYGGFVNGAGIFEDELGRYNQEKAGRLDSLLSILERKNIKLMYAIWPHDLFSQTVWAHQWHNNPYNQLINVADVYDDAEVWEYQKRQYRYLIARYGYSRSMGIWEIINEMNGTDGWAQGRHDEAYNWVKKVDQYFEDHDPYDHPTTASFSGGYGEYRARLYEQNDIPNLHIYPEQSWPKKYSDDLMRSSMYNFAFGARRFWDNFEKPALYGEAGADLTYYDPYTTNYTIAYHNAIWATLTNGMASSPVWWQYTHMSADMWSYLKYLRAFTREINFGNENFAPAELLVKGSDNYAMVSDSSAFGWTRSYNSEDIAGQPLRLKGQKAGTYQLSWFNTWTGEVVGEETHVVVDEVVDATIPAMDQARKDIAFKMNRIDDGTEATRLNLKFKERRLQSSQDSTYTVLCYLTDDQGRLVTSSNIQVEFSLNGPGSLDTNSATTTDGVARVNYHPELGQTGTITIQATANGLSGATLDQQVYTNIDDGKASNLPSEFKLGDNYPNPFNPSTQINYQLPEAAQVSLKVYDIMGREVRALVQARQNAGEHTVQFEAGHLSSGIYFYRLEAENFIKVKRMMLLK